MKDINDLLEERNIRDYESITVFWCDNKNLTSLNGIEKLVNLEELYCHDNKLTSIDLSKNINLKELNCDDNKLISIDLSKNTNLQRLGCYYNKLTSIDLSKNINLKILHCYNNQLTTIDVSKNTKLERLNCNHNQLNIQDLYQQINNNTSIKIINYKNRQEFLSELKHEIISDFNKRKNI